MKKMTMRKKKPRKTATSSKTTRKMKKKKRPPWAFVVGTPAAFIRSFVAFSRAQEPAPPPPQAPPASQTSSSEKPQKQKYSHANDFLIIGTVFDPKGYAFPGAELRVRKSNEKKYR